MAKRLQPIHDLVLDLELGFHGLVISGDRSFFSKDTEGVDGEVDGKDALAQVFVDAGESGSRGVFEHDDFFLRSGNCVLDNHVKHFTRQIEQREHSGRDVLCGKIFSRIAGHCGGRTGRFFAFALAHDVVDSLSADRGALLGLEACCTHNQF